jgi:cobalt-zinc-cadmium efflux system membrane fusion protein
VRIPVKTTLSALVLALLPAWALAQITQGPGGTIAVEPAQFETLGITTATLTPAATASGTPLPARVAIPPAQVRVVSAPQAGLVDALLVAVGEAVEEGQVLARLKSPDLLTLQRDYLQTLTRLGLAGSELERDKALFEEGIIAERRLAQKRSRYAELAAQGDQGRQALHLAGMDEASLRRLERERRLTSDLAVRAPLAGVVLEVMASVGERAEPLAPLYRIAHLDPLWLEVRAPLESAEQAAVGTAVTAVDGAVAGRVLLVGREVDPDSQTVLLRAEVTRGAAGLRPGQFVQVRLGLGQASALGAPAVAVARSGGQAYVFRQVSGGFAAVPVQVLSERAGVAVLRGPLAAGERVASGGVAALKAAWLTMGGE